MYFDVSQQLLLSSQAISRRVITKAFKNLELERAKGIFLTGGNVLGNSN